MNSTQHSPAKGISILVGAMLAASGWAQAQFQPAQPPAEAPAQPPAEAPAQPAPPAEAPAPPAEAPAQPAPPADEGMPLQTEPQAVEMTEAELSQAVNAYISISQLQEQLQAELAGVEDPEVAQARIEAARPRMEAAVEAAGLNVAAYERAIAGVNQDEALRNRFIALLDERRPPQEQQAVQAAPEVDVDAISEDEVVRAAQAYQGISRLNEQLQEDLAGVEDQTVIREHVSQAEQRMVALIENAGLETERYSQVIQGVQQDDGLFKRFMGEIQ